MKKYTNEEIINMIIDEDLRESLIYIVKENQGLLEVYETEDNWIDVIVYASMFNRNRLEVLFKHSSWDTIVSFNKEKQLLSFMIETKFCI
jgi:hypothetical protein